MRLTAKKAVEITRELWTWLAETGDDRKWAWRGWEKYGEMYLNCPLCEYAQECVACPLFNRWEGKESCEEDGTPWLDWVGADSEEARKAAAQRLVNLCEKWLEGHAKPSPS